MNNIATVEVFEEDYRLRNGVYQPGVFNAGPDANLLVLGWQPQENDGTVYTIAVAGTSYEVHRDRSGRNNRVSSVSRKDRLLSRGRAFKRPAKRYSSRPRRNSSVGRATDS